MIDIRRLHWDPGNITHIARYQVSLEEVEEACQNSPMMSQSYMGRLRVIGPTDSGRMLTVILDPEIDDCYYPVTARPASRQERRRYDEEQGGNQT
jgi:uncharacterized DUF497 family protein